MKTKTIVQLVLFLLILPILIFINRDKLFISEDKCFISLVNEYLEKEFNGVVKYKYVDELDHNFRKVIIGSNNEIDHELILNFETNDLYDFIQTGDTLSKRKNSLEINLIRKNLDTILYFRFDNTKGFKNSKVYDSIKDIYW